MAKVQQIATTGTRGRDSRHRKRRGIHSKCRTSKLKSSKHYVKPYRGQGR